MNPLLYCWSFSHTPTFGCFCWPALVPKNVYRLFIAIFVVFCRTDVILKYFKGIRNLWMFGLNVKGRILFIRCFSYEHFMKKILAVFISLTIKIMIALHIQCSSSCHQWDTNLWRNLQSRKSWGHDNSIQAQQCILQLFTIVWNLIGLYIMNTLVLCTSHIIKTGAVTYDIVDWARRAKGGSP